MMDCNLRFMAATEVDFSPMPRQSGNAVEDRLNNKCCQS